MATENNNEIVVDINNKEVGEEVDSYCTACKMDLNHKIVAKKAGVVTKVKCLTCNKEHKYRPPKALTKVKKTPKARTGTGRAKRATPVQKRLYTLEDVTVPHEQIKEYTFTGIYLPKEWIRHQTFGYGEVKGSHGPSKIEVQFGDGVKIMICGKP